MKFKAAIQVEYLGQRQLLKEVSLVQHMGPKTHTGVPGFESQLQCQTPASNKCTPWEVTGGRLSTWVPTVHCFCKANKQLVYFYQPQAQPHQYRSSSSALSDAGIIPPVLARRLSPENTQDPQEYSQGCLRSTSDPQVSMTNRNK